MPSIPEILNSGMLAGVDTSLYLWGVSYYLYSGWGLHPRAFLNSGIRDSLLEHPSFWRHARQCAHMSCKGPLHCPRRALNSPSVPSTASRTGASPTAPSGNHSQPSVHGGTWCQRPLRRHLPDLLHLVDVLTFLLRTTLPSRLSRCWRFPPLHVSRFHPRANLSRDVCYLCL